MIRRRLSVALVAAVGTSLALVTPVQAETPGGSVETILAQSSGSSTSTTDDDEDVIIDDDADDEDDYEMPEWAQSAVLDDEGLLVVEVLRAIMALGLAVTQGATVVLPFIPGGEDMLRDFLISIGIQP
ncbi:hypothetical protein NYP18_06700 [Corynebacterium sp. YIM 101645]|uniref:Secreted protein n=1 Tax=Corynebacterium lemuris TaxID=1859292 RepID=A0ABT2FZI1_9CORY|nr:hypothetical protein [Corynebacterium lemuris]MCS5479344.1 hypothetical protein [Corynebacterium lemuris]